MKVSRNSVNAADMVLKDTDPRLRSARDFGVPKRCFFWASFCLERQRTRPKPGTLIERMAPHGTWQSGKLAIGTHTSHCPEGPYPAIPVCQLLRLKVAKSL
jgi:hypothetical protein